MKGLNDGKGAVGYMTGGWGISGTMHLPVRIPDDRFELQRVRTRSARIRQLQILVRRLANPAVGYAPGSGDYNADGNNLDYPDATQLPPVDQQQVWLTGAIPKSDFAVPTFGTGGGNEKPMQFRRPNFIETNVNFYKDTKITERVNFQFRFELFNLFNRANYANVDTNFPDGKLWRCHGIA